MRLWTFQPADIYETLKKEKVLHTDASKIEMFYFDDEEDIQSRRAYDYLVSKMKEKIGMPESESVQYPWWAWYKFNGKNKQPDLRRKECWYSEDMVCIELELPYEKVLLSDEELWYGPLNNSPIIMEKNDDIWDQKYNEYKNLDETVKQREIKKTWDNCFDISGDMKMYTSGNWIQATFWDLNVNDVKKVRVVKRKSRT